MGLKFVNSQKGKPLLICEGHLYNKIHDGNTITWRCILYKEKSCRACIRTTSDKRSGSIIGDIPEHNHPPNIAKIQAVKKIAEMKKKATKSHDPPSLIVGQTIGNMTEAAQVLLPSRKAMNTRIQRVRKQTNPQLATPASRQELLIPEPFTITNAGSPFLMYDSNDDERLLIFSTNENLLFLAECDIWMADGTFDVVPSIYTQLYTIHGLHGDKVLPLVYALCAKKTKKLYVKILKWIKEQMGNARPRRLIVDFELSFIKAFEKVFPNSDVTGCFFHLTQCVWRHIADNGLKAWYTESSIVSLQLKMLSAIAFVPEDDVIYAYEQLVKSPFYVTNSERLEGLLEYFSSTWIGRKTGRNHSLPRFPPALWNCHDATKNGEPRTNNAAEAWHRAFNERVRVSRAAMGRFIEALKTEQNLVELTLTNIRANRVVAAKRRRKYVQIDQALQGLTATYNRDNILDFLKAIALNL